MAFKKLLHLGCNVGTESMPKYFREQCDYDELRLDANLKTNLQNLSYVPDIVFIQIQSDTIDGKNTCDFIGKEIKALKEKGSFVINWTGDKRTDLPRWMIDFHDFVNVTGFSNQEDVDKAHRYGMNAIFLQQGIDTNIFTPDGDKLDSPDIVFLANNYGNQFPLSRFRRECANSLKAHFGNRFGLYGNGWSHSDGNFNNSQYEEAKLYRGCKIAVSISHFDSARYFSDRLGRSLCSGSFVLSHNYNSLESDFDKGVHLDTFKTSQELVDKCKYWLENDRSEIAKNGTELARKEFSYQNIVKQILELC